MIDQLIIGGCVAAMYGLALLIQYVIKAVKRRRKF